MKKFWKKSKTKTYEKEITARNLKKKESHKEEEFRNDETNTKTRKNKQYKCTIATHVLTERNEIQDVLRNRYGGSTYMPLMQTHPRC